MLFRIGASALQGRHHIAQKSSRTTLPRCCLSTRFHKYDDILLTFCSRSPIILSILRREESCRERAHTESSSLRTKGSSSKLSRDNIRHRPLRRGGLAQ